MIITYSWLDQYKIIGINDTIQYFGKDVLPKYKVFGTLSDNRTVFGTLFDSMASGTLSDRKPTTTLGDS